MKTIIVDCPSIVDAVKRPGGHRVVYDNLLGWMLERYDGNASLVISEKHALWLIRYWQRNPYFV